MKKLAVGLLVFYLTATIFPIPLFARSEANPSATTSPKTAEATEAHILLERLREIKTMDKSALRSSEKKQLRKEVRSAKKRLQELGGGVYLSTAAIIIIILLLILLL